MDDDTSIASRCPRPPHGPFGSPLARSSSSHTRARERTRRANERTNERTRAGYFFPSISSCRRSPVRVASSVSTASAVAHSRGHAMWMFGDARDRDAGDAETRRRAKAREACVGCFFFAGLASASRGRASSRRARASRGRARADDDGPSTGRRRRVDRVNRRGCQSETICSYGLASGVWSLLRKRERERERERRRVTDGGVRSIESSFARAQRTLPICRAMLPV